MDVLRPSLVWVGNRCYRKNEISQGSETRFCGREEETYIDTGAEYQDEICDAGLHITETESGFRLSMAVPAAFHKHVIGKKAETKKRLEAETRTKITVPKQGSEGDVVITGSDRGGVISARTRIEILVEAARQRAPFTHFISFPVTGANIREGFHTFKHQVMEMFGQARGVDETIFQNPDKLHLTVGTLTLVNEAEVQHAADLLNGCYENVLRPIVDEEPLTMSLEGLEYMNDDPSMVDVLYAKVKQGADKLQRLADGMVDYFVAEGIMSRQYDRVKMHVTVINSLMRKDTSNHVASQDTESRRQPIDRESFDASGILEVLGDFDFGGHLVDSVHLSQRYSTGPDGYYNCAARAQLP